MVVVQKNGKQVTFLCEGIYTEERCSFPLDVTPIIPRGVLAEIVVVTGKSLIIDGGPIAKLYRLAPARFGTSVGAI